MTGKFILLIYYQINFNFDLYWIRVLGNVYAIKITSFQACWAVQYDLDIIAVNFAQINNIFLYRKRENLSQRQNKQNLEWKAKINRIMDSQKIQ